MANRLEVEIGADIKEMQKKLGDVQKSLSSFDKKAASNMGKFSKSTKTATKDLKKFDKGAASGSSAMLAFSRTVQDAPFGMMGISNNITNLTEQFGALKARTGSAGGALKAMLRDLSGFGGITLAISLATSAWLMFGDKIMGTKDKVKSLKEEQDKLNESLENYVLSLETVEQANLKGQQSATKELTRLRLLKNQVENGTLSLNKRKGAIEELRKKYPEYLKNMSDEKMLNGGLATTYNTLTTSILKRAKATASMNAIVKNSEQLLVLEDKLLVKQQELKKEQDRVNLSLAQTTKLAGNNPYAGLAKSGAVAGSKLEELKETVKSLKTQVTTLQLSNIDLEQNIDSTGGLFEDGNGGNDDGKLRKRVEAVGTGLSNSLNGIQDLITTNPLDLSQAIPVEPVNEAFNENMNAVLLNAQMKALQFTEGIKQTLGSSFANTFSQLGESLGNGLRNVDSIIVGGLGSLLSSMGDYLIQAGTAAVLAGTITKLFGSIAGIGAGFAAIAGGVLLKGIGSSISNFGGAGGGGGNTSNAGTSNTSSGSTSFSGGATATNSGGTYVFEIAGTKLVGVLKNTLDRNKNLGGTLSIT